ncbi:CDP-alcohol phosphatidyltransferase family protein [Candidatus Leptofilum sp.]|uniref:CDP-alcohol phosphatidyltransferase family protein n=1 Tax=Candidatus Leptofilum sp. TaxID=3241576 RepID=UPI003B5AFC59
MFKNSHRDTLSRFRVALPLGLTTIRVVLAPLILVWAGNGRAGLPYVFCLILAFVTDYFDGVVARKLDVATATIRRYDSAADVIFYVAALTAVWLVYPEVVVQNWLGIVLVAGLEAIRVTTDFVKFRREASYHMWSAKGWNITLFAALTGLMGFGISGWLFRLPIVVGILTNMEGLAASILLPSWTHDVPTIFHAYRIRQRSKR